MDSLIDRARDLVVGHQRGSISLVQRKLGISYAEASAILEELERQGIVGPVSWKGGREVLVLPNAQGGLSPAAPKETFEAWFEREYTQANGYVSTGDPTRWNEKMFAQTWARLAWEKARAPGAAFAVASREDGDARAAL